MRLRLFLLAALCLAGCFSASAQWGPDALNYSWGHLKDGKQRLTDQEVLEIIGEDIYNQTYVGARKQYKAGVGLLIGGGVVTLTGVIVSSRAESFITDRGKGTLWNVIKEVWKNGSVENAGLDEAAEDIAKGMVWYACGWGVSYLGSVVLRIGIPFFVAGSKRLDWIADDYNEHHSPVLEVAATPYGPGLRLRF